MKAIYTQAQPIPYLNVSEGARLLGVTHQRFSRAITKLEIPVIRQGYSLLFPRKKLRAVGRYLTDKKSGAKKTG